MADGNHSNPYRPGAAFCCERCAFGSGEHAEFCEQRIAQAPPDAMVWADADSK
jgi:hypothetical protein